MAAFPSTAQRPGKIKRILGVGEKHEPVLVNGKPIHGRLIQQILWGVLLGTALFGLAFSGLYFGATQVHWYIHIGSFYHSARWVKPMWDQGFGWFSPHSWLINTSNWADYRHPYRNIGLASFAVMGALSITGGAKKMAGRWYTAFAPLIILASALVLITAGVWVTLWANAKTGGASHLVTAMEAAALAFIVGRVLHILWKPAGTRIQHFIVERMVDRFFRRGYATQGLPVWVKYPLAPPTMREAGQLLITDDRTNPIPGELTEAERLAEEGKTRRSSAVYWVAAAVLILVLALDFVGFIGHFWVGVFGHDFPYLAPPQ
jgi:hypothetical protein